MHKWICLSPVTSSIVRGRMARRKESKGVVGSGGERVGQRVDVEDDDDEVIRYEKPEMMWE